jgi:hypothetical protein
MDSVKVNKEVKDWGGGRRGDIKLILESFMIVTRNLQLRPCLLLLPQIVIPGPNDAYNSVG